jgi:ribonuclease HI
MQWLWKQGIPKLATIREAPATIALTTGENPLPDTVPRIEPTQGFRTLGVYLTPSGQYTSQVKVLRRHAEQLKQLLSQSHLSPSEAYCCLMMYVRPKLNYPDPSVSLTEIQCHHILAPIMEAILPKSHLNRHTPRAVLFARPRFGGMSIPEKYTDLGYGHLQYMVGHVKMGDDIGQLILSLVTHTQLQVGASESFLKLPYPIYAKWIDTTWVTDCWKFVHRLNMVIDLEHQWVPTLPREGDIAIMDLALTFHLNFHQLQRINTCRMYLQVVSVSDLATAKGDKLLSSAIQGVRDPQHPSTLNWPLIPRPPDSFWQTWKLFLQYFTRGKKLMTALGIWRNSPARVWKWFQSTDRVTWAKLGEDDWHCYQPEFPTRRQTRHSPAYYSTSAMATPPSTCHLFPATIEFMPDGRFIVSVSATRFAEPAQNPQPDLWQNTNPSEVFQDTPTFFQHLISTPPASEECEAIATELTEKTLVVCSDGACDTSQAVSSYATVLASGLLQSQLATVVGPVDGHPALVTSYRAELSGIIATLYNIYRICSYYHIVEGGMTLYCDNKGALRNAFKQIKPGATPYFNTDHDLIEVAQALITLIPIVISTSWVKGHYEGKDKKYQHTLNEEADRLAGQYQSNQRPHYTIRKPISRPNYKIRLHFDSSIVTAQIKKIIDTQMHDAALEDHIIQKAHWTKSVFHKIHWDAP